MQSRATVEPCMTSSMDIQQCAHELEVDRRQPDRPWTSPNLQSISAILLLKVLEMVQVLRSEGIRAADTDPLRLIGPRNKYTLDDFGLGEMDPDTQISLPIVKSLSNPSLSQILSHLNQAYCGSAFPEISHISDAVERNWLQDAVEGVGFYPQLSDDEMAQILKQLAAAEALEECLQRSFPLAKRFSLEGSETLIVALQQVVKQAAISGASEVVLGMAHRGRLNVLVNVFGLPPRELFSLFEYRGKQQQDLKYHLGANAVSDQMDSRIALSLIPNPSHLETIGPVVSGIARAKQQRLNDTGGRRVIPLIVHGDAAFSGQGVVMETLSLGRTRGYGTGGTIHIVLNNQVGFTASDIRDTRSSRHATDVAKMVEAPIFHVNGADPLAVAGVVRIAAAYRQRFGHDVVVNLMCFRRRGHNEQDIASLTQPAMANLAELHPGAAKSFADKHLSTGAYAKAKQEAERCIAQGEHAPGMDAVTVVSKAEGRNGLLWDVPVTTALSHEAVSKIATVLTTPPEDFVLHPMLHHVLGRRRQMAAGEINVDWGMAECLALGSLVDIGYGVRLSGMDSGRGTFGQRHACWHHQTLDRSDQKTYVPLRNIRDGQGKFTVIDSLLSEEAVLSFEYGYSTVEHSQLTIWEAQYGDFVNGAQVAIDQYIATGEAKWGRASGLVVMLPHGHEGVGPEHSSGHLGRILLLGAEDNIQVCVPSTAAQMFHLLRRQMLRDYIRPMFVYTPKTTLYENPDSHSSLEHFTSGSFQPVVDDTSVDVEEVVRVVLVSGKFYYDLKAHADATTAVIRVEQLYPFPKANLANVLNRYRRATVVRWAQEEAKNHGAWFPLQEDLGDALAPWQELEYVGRPSFGPSAVSDPRLHKQQQAAVIEAALH